MRKHLKIGIWILNIVCVSWFGNWNLSKAIYNPLEVPNNRFGVHVFEPSEIFEAAKLVNSSGGDWGYITVPIRSNDRDYFKWQAFFRASAEFHLIPIIRLATYPIKDVWAEPTMFDIIDFANFLDRFTWPTQNRYIILFNEPNHAKEWGGSINPEKYTQLAGFAYQTFKNLSPNFFLLTAGLDMSAPTNHTSLDALLFYRRMFLEDSKWPNYFDGFSFHPYPNPAFSASAFTTNRYGIRSYQYELNILKRYGVNPKFLFFTETGTKNSSGFYHSAFNSIWKDPRIVAVTPFILYAPTGDFSSFSLLNSDHSPTRNYQEIFNIPKTSGRPLINETQISAPPSQPENQPNPDQNHVRSYWQLLIDLIVQ